jgi:hypothetical protein
VVRQEGGSVKRQRRTPAAIGGFRDVAVRAHQPGDKLGDWTIVRYGYRSMLFCSCPEGHEQLIDGSQARRNLKAGKALPACECCAAAARECA